MNSATLMGLRIIESELAYTIVTTFSVGRHPTNKRRRNWRVVRTETVKPLAYKLQDGTIIMHPTLFAQLNQHTKPAQGVHP